MLTLLHDASVTRLIQIALNEDIATGDVTTETIIPDDTSARASFLCKQDGVLCGISIGELVFRTLGEGVSWHPLHSDGESITKGTVVARLEGPAHILLAGERTALNFMQRMSGVATMARRFAEAVEGTQARILDTRKTIPAWRRLDKYAAQTGGAVNHRMGLYDMMMIKDNHIAAAGGITRALDAAREIFEQGAVRIEIETASIANVREACDHGGFHRIMFDNFTLDMLREGVQIVARRFETEASGGITLDTVRGVAETGVDFISTGAITHSATALDISMDIALARH
ncbi:MAG: carboxylating nicotinate-nucleotide diphosphorylase [Candidatus Kapabacteria bacterium]|nr:carboxylating nicotinate-nucleotide diphosphorylase [Candidatus Kapabacteria bacterium]